jgi:hypothetical protein
MLSTASMVCTFADRIVDSFHGYDKVLIDDFERIIIRPYTYGDQLNPIYQILFQQTVKGVQ